jgi:hypothetical protein
MRQVIWTKHAQNEKINALIYWTKHNHSSAYSKKINKESRRILSLVKGNPFIGEEVEDIKGVRRVIVLEAFSLFILLMRNISKYFLFGITGEILKILFYKQKQIK